MLVSISKDLTTTKTVDPQSLKLCNIIPIFLTPSPKQQKEKAENILFASEDMAMILKIKNTYLCIFIHIYTHVYMVTLFCYERF